MCFYSYRHVCQTQIIGYLSIHLHEESEEPSPEAETLAFRDLAWIPSSFKMLAASSFPEGDSVPRAVTAADRAKS